MLKLKTDRQVTLIVNNVVRACADIHKLSKVGYNYLYLCSGFIARYNLYGFRHYYQTGRTLRLIILERRPKNQWRNFRVGDQNYEYYNQKAEIYNRICVAIAT